MNEFEIRKLADEVGFSKMVQNNWELLSKFAEAYIEKEFSQNGWITPGTVYSILRRHDLKTSPLHKQKTKLAMYPAYFRRSDLKKTFPKEEFK